MEGGDGACRARLARAGPRAGSRCSSAVSRPPARQPSGRSRPRESRQPRRRFDHETTAGLAESIRARGRPASRRPVASRGRLRADRRRAALAGRPGGGTGDHPCGRSRAATARTAARARRERRPRTAHSRRGGAGLRPARRRVRAGSRRDRRPGRTVRPSVSNRMRLLDLPEDVLAMLERGELSEGHAQAVLAVPDHEDRRRLAREIVKRGLSVRRADAPPAGPARTQAPESRPHARRSRPRRSCPDCGRTPHRPLRPNPARPPGDCVRRRDPARRAGRSTRTCG